jgi:hypothetical protein
LVQQGPKEPKDLKEPKGHHKEPKELEETQEPKVHKVEEERQVMSDHKE